MKYAKSSVRKISNLLAVTLFAGVVPTAFGALVRIDFAGSIDLVNAGGYAVGQPFTGTIVYESDTPFSAIFDSPTQANFNGALHRFTLGALAIDTISFNIINQVYFSADDRLMDFSLSGHDPITGFDESLAFKISGPTVFQQTLSLPAEPDIESRTWASFHYTSSSGSWSPQVQFSGSVNTVSSTVVPEPSSALLLVLGSAFCFQRRLLRRNERNPQTSKVAAANRSGATAYAPQSLRRWCGAD